MKKLLVSNIRKSRVFKEDFDQQLYFILEKIGGLNLHQDQPQNVKEVISALGNSPTHFKTTGNPYFNPLGNRKQSTNNFVAP